ncbi:hypothetical protein KFK09_026994 [Dendrobium nobile]|uniref:Retrovirus-related Pol polyprotein from transposon TNT 1-94 n=1 Tax=Dendrobium nobile TaxID=94219 RepID=A0A8T3A9B0_DENNO|nr:hypothetical protein KFK09_026994 [Dendrobium nobile]
MFHSRSSTWYQSTIASRQLFDLMADERSADSRRTSSGILNQEIEFTIPPHLKFLIANIKNLVPTQLTADNYAIWRLQLFQHFSANGFEDHLTGLALCPSQSESDAYARWKLTDRNLVSALLSTISSSILPYILSLTMASEVWFTLECRLQPTNRSRVIQLKNELHQIQMKDRTMQQYLDQIKKIVDSIATAGSTVDTEDIILYILNGLPTAYNPFKTAIRTSLQPINLDDLYSLLCSEEINIKHQHLQEIQHVETTAFLSNRSSNYRGKSNMFRGRGAQSRPQTSNETQNSARTVYARPICQICGKTGHSALNCWHRCNLNYAPPSNPRALTVQQHHSSTNDWILDSSASSHLTSDVANINHPTTYNDFDLYQSQMEVLFQFNTRDKEFFLYPSRIVSSISITFYTSPPSRIICFLFQN